MNVLKTFIAILFLVIAGNNVAGDVVVVVIKDFKFIPDEVTIKAGQTIRWENREKRQYHSVWFEALGEDESDYLFPDESHERKFDSVGNFPYRCGPHPKMIGTVTVAE